MESKIILVTGGNKGIGLETTRLLVDAGHRVIVVARDFAGFEFRDHPSVRCIEFDLSQTIQISELVESIGAIDVLINNAGVMYSLPYDNYPDDKIESMLKLNLESPVRLIEAVSKGMLERGGRIVNNASIAGQIGHPDVWYGITKAGLINATKSFAKIFEGKIVVNAVAPSPVETEMLQTIPIERREAFLKMAASKRFATSEEVAKTIVWLALESPEYINGSCIDLNSASYVR